MNTQLHLSELAAEPPLTAWTPKSHFTMLDVVEATGGGDPRVTVASSVCWTPCYLI